MFMPCLNVYRSIISTFKFATHRHVRSHYCNIRVSIVFLVPDVSIRPHLPFSDLERRHKPTSVYIPILLGFTQELRWTRDTSAPYCSETNGFYQGGSRVQKGTAATLVQFGLSADCQLWNVHGAMAGGKTAFDTRFGFLFAGLVIPSGTTSSAGLSLPKTKFLGMS